jgi:uncharacterized protein YgbK (DUF1537 family)
MKNAGTTHDTADAEAAVRAVVEWASALARVERAIALSTRRRTSTLAAIEAREDGVSLKQLVCRALAGAGIAVAPVDLG